MTALSEISDLSEYYTIKKYRHGWVLGRIADNETFFISREKLITMGYLENSEEPETNEITMPPNVIIVPTESYINNTPRQKIPVKYKNRADNDTDWRKNKNSF